MQLLLRELLAAPSSKQWLPLEVLLEVNGKGATGLCAGVGEQA